MDHILREIPGTSRRGTIRHYILTLERLLKERACGDCWCQVGIDNPMMQGRHDKTCDEIRELFGVSRP